jgi:hypothetical protein
MTQAAGAIFFISAASLALELILIRILSIGHWHHFSYLIISTALLGFGTGGTAVSIFEKFLKSRYKPALWTLSMCLAINVPLVFAVSQKVGFDELQLIWDWQQLIYLFAYYLLFFIPFFFAGTCVALAFAVFSNRAQRLYFFNMTGSGLGAAAAVFLMYGCAPEKLLLAVSVLAFLGASFAAADISRRRVVFTLALASTIIIILYSKDLLPLEINISQHKSLVYYRSLPGAEVPATRYSPLGRLDLVRAPAIRYFPGLSIAYKGSLPKQSLIISDGDGVSPINHFEGINELDCYNYMTSALCYHLLMGPEVCIIGAGGGSDAAQAIALGAKKITAVEMNPQTIKLARDFDSGLYERDDVRLVIAEGRNFLQTSSKQFDIINISLLDSFSASAAGLYALNESHLYTIEAIEQALGRLRPAGLLSITRMLKTPPRDSLKMLATIAVALQKHGIEKPEQNIVMIRSFFTTTIVASPTAFSDPQIELVREFCRQRRFDIVHLPGLRPEQANQFDMLDEPVYYNAAQQILSQDREAFFDNYAYNIRPAADDKPYFFDFFKWKALPYMIRTVRGRWLVFSEWGYLVMVATLLQAIIASTIFILLPVIIAKPIKTAASGKLVTLCYFLLLGLAYMFLEMGFIQKMTLLIGHPVFGVAVSIVGFLIFSGLGSLASGRWLQRADNSVYRLIVVAVAAIIVIGVIDVLILTFSFEWLVGFSRIWRMVLGVVIIAPLAFFMGIPFPSGLRQLSARNQPLVPWAWCINGFASVTAAVLGTCLAVSFGFAAVGVLALASYFLAAVIARRICSGFS